MQLQIISKLAYSWTGWPRPRAVPNQLPERLLDCLPSLWISDGLSLVDWRRSDSQWQMTFRSDPCVQPVEITRKVKGRLVHSLRKEGYQNCFKRTVSLRSLGDNSRNIVLNYVATQLDRSDLADPRYVDLLDRLKFCDENISLKHPQVVTHGRYWINLHIVIVIADRYIIRERKLWNRIRKTIISWGEEVLNHTNKDTFYPALKSFSIMPDHVHIVLRAPIDRSPQFLLENLWHRMNGAAGFLLCSDEVYVGTFSEYSIGAIRRVQW